MALMPVKRIIYKENQREEEKLEFVHELRRIHAEDSFRNPHKQDFYEIIVFNSGIREVRIGDKSAVYGAGDILILTPEEMHVGRSHDCLLDRYVLHFGREAFSVFGERGRQLLSIFTDRELYTGNHIRLAPEAAARLGELLADTDRTLKLDSKGTAMLDAAVNMMEILILLRRWRNQSEEKRGAQPVLLRLLAYMETNYASVGNMEEVCREFGVSRSSMWRMFRDHLHQTPGDYLRNIRLQRARQALELGGSVTAVCMECGFADCSHFIRLFRDVYGVTPYQYKREQGISEGETE